MELSPKVMKHLKESFANLTPSEWQECKEAEAKGEAEMAAEMLKDRLS